MTSAVSSDGRSFGYAYDANGSLLDDGSKTYVYDAANRLVAVENAGVTSALSYNGLGQRMSMSAEGITTQYVMSGNRPLSATSNGNTTTYLYGLGSIAEESNAWSYSLPDGTNTPRQLADASGDITLSARYTPWGDTLETYGDGGFTFGYFGGMMDAATGLLYVGNGQYYDPYTGRFLTRDAKPENSNPYIPYDPIGALVAPLGLLSLYYSRKKNPGKLGMWLVLLIVVGSVGVGLSACGTFTNSSGKAVTASATVSIPAGTATPTVILTLPATVTFTPSPTWTPTPTITETPCPTSTPTPTVKQKLLDIYGVSIEDGNMKWELKYISIALTAVEDIANRFGSAGLFRVKFEASASSPIRLIMGTASSYNPEIIGEACRQIGAGGCTTGNIINFAALSPHRNETARNNIVHELGHAFDNIHGDIPETKLGAHPAEFEEHRGQILHDNSTIQWQLNKLPIQEETFADFFVAWTYNVWRPLVDADGNKTRAGIAKEWMDTNMPNW